MSRQDIPNLVHKVIRCLSSQTTGVVLSLSAARQEGLETAPTAVTTTATTAAFQDPSGLSLQTFTTLTEPAASSLALPSFNHVCSIMFTRCIVVYSP